jgi:hypothetical protein
MDHLSDIAKLRHYEPARLDRIRLEQLIVEHGEPGAERLVGRTLDNIALRLNRCERAWRGSEDRRVCEAAEELAIYAEHIGLVSLERVALDVAAAAAVGDHVALGATLARLVRIGESSLMSAWDLTDLSI